MKNIATLILNRNLPGPTDKLVEKIKKTEDHLTDIYVIEAGSDNDKLSKYYTWHVNSSDVIQNGLTYGDKVYVKVHKGNKKALIVIEDDGPGIPENQYKNVFKPFFRLDKSRSLNQSGVGLGLAIVEDIINSHGGNIQLGKSKFNGLLVKISLPL